ncbi:MAG: hypothetical protein WD055_02580 [Candidatus Dependentiae bacterium]
MKQFILIIIVLLSQYTFSSGITFGLNGGRLGDNILNYCKHKWISLKYNIDLYVPDFKYKNKLPLHHYEKSKQDLQNANFSQTKKLHHDSQINTNIKNCIYVGNYYLTIDDITNRDAWPNYIFKLSIEHPEFGAQLKKMLTPEINHMPLPQDIITVALHIRKGGGVDLPLSSQQYIEDKPKTSNTSKGADKYHPLKFPPEQYYLDQLLTLYTILDEQPLYAYIFTDDKHPEKITQRIQAHCKNKNIIFDCRKEDNVHNKNVLYDVCLMSKFDYLIRSGSHFPWISQIIGNHKGIIFPQGSHWEGNNLIMGPILFVEPNRKSNIIVETKIS